MVDKSHTCETPNSLFYKSRAKATIPRGRLNIQRIYFPVIYRVRIPRPTEARESDNPFVGVCHNCMATIIIRSKMVSPGTFVYIEIFEI